MCIATEHLEGEKCSSPNTDTDELLNKCRPLEKIKNSFKHLKATNLINQLTNLKQFVCRIF